MSKSERVFWNFARNDKLGFRFRRQFPVDKYVLDFYCPAAKLCIEIDGPHHQETQTRDCIRDQYLESLGILTIRIPTTELFEVEGAGIFAWADRVREACEARSAN